MTISVEFPPVASSTDATTYVLMLSSLANDAVLKLTRPAVDSVIAAVQSGVFGSAYQFQILDPIIGLVSVDVVDNLVSSERAG